MDVDLLRPGTVPISPDTTLWFEFLLDPSLLKKHLTKSLPDPSAYELIVKFLTLNSESIENEGRMEPDSNDSTANSFQNKWNHKNLALKILSLKVAAFLNWDLNVLEKNLPLMIQANLLQDLFYITSDKVVEIPNLTDISLDSATDQLLFTVILYHRWHLRAIIYRALNNRQIRQQSNHGPGIPEQKEPLGIIEDMMKKLDIQATKSVETLNEILKLENFNPKVISFDTFQSLDESTTELKQNWENMISVPLEEMKCQIHYDLSMFHMLREEYQNAKDHAIQAKEFFEKITGSKTSYCILTKEQVQGCLLACGVEVENIQTSLTQKLMSSIKNQYEDIVQILIADNIEREIPQVYRDNLELDIQGGLVNRKIVVSRDLLLKIQCLNLVRKILGNEVILGDYIVEIKAAKADGLKSLFWAMNNVLEHATAMDKKRLSRFLLYLVLTGDINDLTSIILNEPKYASLFDARELEEIEKKAHLEEIQIPELLLNNDWGISYVSDEKSQRLQVNDLEQRLIQSYDPAEIREILMALEKTNSKKVIWKINNNWDLPIPLQSAVIAHPKGFLQDYYYVLLAKSRETAMSKDFVGAKKLLMVVEESATLRAQNSKLPIAYKLCQMLSWENLLLEIWHCLHSWPATEFCDLQAVVEKCKQCLAALQSTDQVIPRQEVIEYCTVFLLNMNEWDYLTSIEKRWSYADFAVAVSTACQDIVKFKGSRKFPREVWDLVLSAFASSREQSQKRNANSGGTSSRDLMVSITGTLCRLREATSLNVVISLLSRFHNILKDDSTSDLYIQYLGLWPGSIPNVNSYSVRHVSECLFQLLIQALKYYPNNIQWLRLMADLNFVLGYYDSAMKYYLQAMMVSSDFFTLPMPRNPIDDLVYRRMIKCCSNLQCFTQATVLCQFLEEVDYALAFKMAANDQKISVSSDAMDAYYHCIWDTTILEYLIQLHTKRGEHHRRQLAIKVIGLLELNSNNNEEIQREAANIRKGKFLRALAKQYVY